jgi:hypothetical protein
MKIVLVGFLLDCHGCSCDTHPYGCGNAFIESVGNGVGRFVHLRLVDKTNLAVHKIREDGTDGCRICFTAREYACGPHAHKLDGALLRIMKVFLPDSENRSMRALYHRNRGYTFAETVGEVE